jgi:hypothetical protein
MPMTSDDDREATTRPITDDERRLIEAAHRLGISPAQGIWRMCSYTVGMDDGLTMDDAQRELERFIRRVRLTSPLPR